MNFSANGPGKANFEFIDGYLLLWDRFAEGENALIAKIRGERARFETELAAGLAEKDPRAMSRFVFYLVVQVGGFVPSESELGRAFFMNVDTPLPEPAVIDGKNLYFAGDVFFWWEKHKAEFKDFSLFEEWKSREFARNTVIPMYRSVVKPKRPPHQ